LAEYPSTMRHGHFHRSAGLESLESTGMNRAF
jgi:hypothetical protein